MCYEEERVMSYSGPAKTYADTGAYKPSKITKVEGLFTEGSFIFVDLQYSTVGRRRLYMFKSAFKNTSHVPEAYLTGFGAHVTSRVTALYGPGKQYDNFLGTSINEGTPINVMFEENGFVFAEFDCSLGVVRAWIPVGNVKADQASRK